MQGGSVPTDEARLHSLTTFERSLLYVTRSSNPRSQLVAPKNILLMSGYRGHLSGSGFEPANHVSCPDDTLHGHMSPTTASFAPLTIGRPFQNSGMNSTFERVPPPIRHLKLLFTSNPSVFGRRLYPSGRQILFSVLTTVRAVIQTSLSNDHKSLQSVRADHPVGYQPVLE